MQTTSAEYLVTDPLKPVADIARVHGVTCSPEQFHAAVNVTFHKYESEIYDEIHTDMWESLPQQFALLADDCLRQDSTGSGWRMLDIGCGTGLASDSIMKSSFRPKISSIDLLDTSTAMLTRASQRASAWDVPVQTFEGVIERLEGIGEYDLVVTCSVLHHVPDLISFLGSVRRLQRAGGIFLHLQDPNGDFMHDPEFVARMTRTSKKRLPEWAARLAPQRVIGRLVREVTGQQGEDYLSKTNRDLLSAGIIKSPLSVAEIFQITDIHVQDGAGVSIKNMAAWLPEYRLVSHRSYAFFGPLWSTLSPAVKAEEDRLIAARALNGGHVGAAWRLNV